MEVNSLKKCFLCGCELTKKNLTDEHIFPKWLLKSYPNLKMVNECSNISSEVSADKERNLVEKKYTKLKVNCCKECNNEKLSKIENIVEKCTRKGKLIDKEEKNLKFWMLKIMVARNICDSYRQVLNKEREAKINMIINNLNDFIAGGEALLIERSLLLEFKVTSDEFDYQSSIDQDFVIIVINKRAYILLFNSIGNISTIFDKISRKKLHIFQCYEILSYHILMLAKIREMGINDSFLEENKSNEVYITLREPNPHEMAFHLATFWNSKYSHHTGCKLVENDLIDGDGICLSFIFNKRRRFIRWPKNSIPMV